MSQAFLKAAQGVADTSYSRAIEHVLTMAKHGISMREMLASVGMDHWENPTWEDVVYALAYVHRRLDTGLLKASPVKLNPPKDHPLARALVRRDPPEAREFHPAPKRPEIKQATGPKTRTCLKCRKPFMSEGPHNRTCPSCQRSNATAMSGDMGGLYA